LFLIVGGLASSPLAAANDSSAFQDGNGAPAGYRLGADALFRPDGTLNKAGREAVGGIYRNLEGDPKARISIFAYTDSQADSVGGADAVRPSGASWAISVRGRLLALGLDPRRIEETGGKGALDPLADNATAAGRSLNRRVEVVLLPAPVLQVPGGAAPVPGAISQAPAKAPSGDDVPLRFALGAGYPDVRARVALGYGVDVEGKFAFEQGIQVYSGRLYWHFTDLGPLLVDLGAEGGVARFNEVDSINGSGSFVEVFLALEYPFARCLRLCVDVGPAHVQASSDGFTYTSNVTVVNTALYLYLF